jgi:hypothetical protein
VVKCEQNSDRDFKICPVSTFAHGNNNAGARVGTENHEVPEQRGFCTEDVLWTLGIWSTIACLSPVIAFYLLMVA